MATVTGDRSISWEYARLKEESRRRHALTMLFVWMALALMSMSWGGYIMYLAMTKLAIIQGFLLMIAAVFFTFMAICSTLDLMGD